MKRNDEVCEAFFDLSTPRIRAVKSNRMRMEESTIGAIGVRRIYSYARLLATADCVSGVWIFRGIYPGRSSRTTARHITGLCRAATAANVTMEPVE